MFVRMYNKYIKRNGLKHFDKKRISYIRKLNTLIQDEGKKEKSIGSCYNYGRTDHYKRDFLLFNKDEEKGQQKKTSKRRRVYIAWDSDNDSSNVDSLSESDEMKNYQSFIGC